MRREYTARIGAREFKVSAVTIESDIVSFEVGGNRYAVTLEAPTPIASVSHAVTSSPIRAVTQPLASHPNSLSAPISGVVVSLNVKVGAQVSAGEVLAVLEAMKMENPIKSDRAGTIKTVHVQPGKQVRTGEPIVTFE